ncbi:MAG TPA: hypothetical protein VFG10_08115 [Saprospiraceae bacterium]|nr:hypothetical protein [Saprospiraceae bacterium]
MMTKINIAGFFLVLFSLGQVTAQNGTDSLKQQLVGKTTLAEIMPIVEKYYSEHSEEGTVDGDEFESDYLQWKRWEWYMSRRLGPNGEFVHIPKMNLQALQSESTPRSSRNAIEGTWTSIGMKKSSFSADTAINYPPGASGNSYAKGTGRVDRIAFHPTNANIIYVGCPNGGLWRTNDGGQHWECLTDTLPSIGISGIVVDYVNPANLYILTGTGDDNLNSYSFVLGMSAPSMGVMKSTDAGVTWAFTSSLPTTAGLTQYFSYDLVQSPTTASVLLAATSDGIFRTANSGTTWTKVRNGLHFDLQFKPGSGTTVYAATDDSLFYSTNGGVNWSSSGLNVAPNVTPVRVSIAVSPATPSRVYAFFGNSGAAGQFAGVYRSENSGVNFTRRAISPNVLSYELDGSGNSSQAGYDLVIAVDKLNSKKVMISSINIWTSIDSAVTFTNNTGWFENQGATAYVHCDHHALVCNPLDNKIYAGNDGGIWVTSNFGSTWTNISEGLVVNQFYHLSQYANVSYKFTGGLQDNGIKYRNTGSTDFIHMYGADGFSTSFVVNNSDVFYASINAGLDRIKFSDGSDVSITPPGDGQTFKEVLAHPTVSNLVFCGSTPISRSTDQGTTWTSVGASGIWGMAISPTVPSRMYATGGSSFWPVGSSPGVWTSADTGKIWTGISGNPGFPGTINIITDIAVDPVSAGTVYVTRGGFLAGAKIYRSTDFGANWTNYSANLPNVVANCIVATQDAVFVGTDISVYYRLKSGSTWINIGENMPHSPVTELLVDEQIGMLTAATFGRGVWQRSYCIEDINLTYPLAGKLQFDCDDDLTSSSQITGTTMDSISFKAGGTIKLLPGFKAGTGTYFTTKKQPCDDGNIPLIMPSPASVVPSAGKVEKRIRK